MDFGHLYSEKCTDGGFQGENRHHPLRSSSFFSVASRRSSSLLFSPEFFSANSVGERSADNVLEKIE
ncbi:hypothetical protein U9M48_018285 [Paspalum notatum var. saurae]|uniref:Uncharacterized protein n=1 Tax=Paspalum notatum var. saurae TaxID=547442 RepID=A0AAQ3TAC5_PASNO